jgi:hypothetical protein
MRIANNQADLSGMLGEIISIRKVGGRVIITNRPKRKMGKQSNKQRAYHEKFREASRYASLQMAQEETRVLYTNGITTRKRSVYLVAMSDYFNAPHVNYFDALNYRGVIGDPIRVNASDDFMVAKVKITITNAAGVVIEEGEALPHAMRVHLWEYTATATNPSLAGTTIRAVAYDRPGNKGEGEVVL